MESNSLKGSNIQTVHSMSSNLVGLLLVTIEQKCHSVQMVHSMEPKFGMYIIGHRLTYSVLILVNLGLLIFLQEYKKDFLYITAYEVKL